MVPALSTLKRRLLYGGRACVALSHDPNAGIERVVERAAQAWDLRSALPRYRPSPDWAERLHHQLGADWPCKDREAFDVVWSRAVDGLREQGLRVGKGAFGGWDDGDLSFARAAWCLVVHARPGTVVETGVARGLTSRCILEGMLRNSRGHLWSIDLAPLIDNALSSERGAAVDESCGEAWTLIDGSSRQRLPGLLKQLQVVDLFVHDSMHTTRNVQFELECIWPVLRPGGYVLVDDIDFNRAFATMPDLTRDGALIVPHDDGVGFFGIARKA